MNGILVNLKYEIPVHTVLQFTIPFILKDKSILFTILSIDFIEIISVKFDVNLTLYLCISKYIKLKNILLINKVNQILNIILYF